MKVINRQELMGMPSGTVYQEWQPCIFGDICVKQDTIVHDGVNIDWFYNLQFPEGDGFIDDGEANGFEISQMRDGCFDEKQQYAIWSVGEINAFVSMIMNEEASA
jgi:hypothetical protein